MVFEGTYDTYQLYGFSNNITMLGQSPQRGSVEPRHDFACIMHSVPKRVAGSDAAMEEMVQELRGVAGAVFVTDLYEDYYSSFGTCWGQFVEVAKPK